MLFKQRILMREIVEQVNLLYFQVVQYVGLCIALHDIIKLEDSHIFPGDGSSHTKVLSVCPHLSILFKVKLNQVLANYIV